MGDLYRRWTSLHLGLRLLIVAGAAAVIVIGAPTFVAGLKSGYNQGTSEAPTPAVTTSLPARPASTATAIRPATRDIHALDFPGDTECTITYRDNGDGSMTWVATVTVDGELVTHASDSDGNIYRHDVHVTRGPNAFRAPVPLAQIDDIGGNLTSASHSYGCSTGPARG